MTDIGPISSSSLSSVSSSAFDRLRTPGVVSPKLGAAAADRVDLSELALLRSRLRALPAVREGLVSRVRSQIEQGGYETPSRIEGAIDGFFTQQSEFEGGRSV